LKDADFTMARWRGAVPAVGAQGKRMNDTVVDRKN
jgi:hypothetical protein